VRRIDPWLGEIFPIRGAIVSVTRNPFLQFQRFPVSPLIQKFIVEKPFTFGSHSFSDFGRFGFIRIRRAD
ncbi:MAG TPA: hypothetical protein DDW50_09720, partial [Firmicutes bacterium]|nr:hypothetical protein [Bacillota bacterium]